MLRRKDVEPQCYWCTGTGCNLGYLIILNLVQKNSNFLYHIDFYLCRAVTTDTGNYSCEPSNAESDTVQVHVLEGTGNNDNG